MAFEMAAPGVKSRVDSGLKKSSAPTNLKESETALWAAFELADRDGNGVLSQKEFGAALKAVGLAKSESEVRLLLRSHGRRHRCMMI